MTKYLFPVCGMLLGGSVGFFGFLWLLPRAGLLGQVLSFFLSVATAIGLCVGLLVACVINEKVFGFKQDRDRT